MIRMVDKDGDGQVSLDEFYEMVTGGKAMPPELGAGILPPAAAGDAPPDGAPPQANARNRLQQDIQKRNEKKGALDEFSKQYNIKPETIKKAYKRFQATDKDNSGMIDYTEFCEILQCDPAPETQKMFSMFDKDGSGLIDVKEFMIGLSNFSGAGKEEKLKFAFMVFDEDGNGVITQEELVKILKANHMASSEREVLRKAETIMAQADKDGDGVISFEEFQIISNKFPNILFPTLNAFNKLQNKVSV
eukprot:TRINITY_DN705_c0_g1_i2.p1 TRINITY_DN705_c0_g1~~TRINITY_DN705_c0_g1_i2.p1  ORF type:complete len:247 (+),score=86.30 TRINITY_DN705_c0_g1_i2:894-1634(+)